jgi:predicted anti-sigma-YlaC factor YlaD
VIVPAEFVRKRTAGSGPACSPSCAVSLARVRRSVLLTCMLLLTGCSTVQKYATNAVADSMAQSGAVYASDDDMELVGAATPFGLKSIESLLQTVPEHRGLLLAAARGFTQYSYAYVQLPAEEQMLSNVSVALAERERAKRMYVRARGYGVRGLAVGRPGFEALLATDPQSAVMETDVGDTALLYWTAMAWAAAIAIGNDDPFLLADLPVIEALIKRAIELDEDFDNGAIYTLLISLEMSRGAISKEATQRARDHFKRAVELSGGMQAAPYVTLAEAVAIRQQDRDEYTRLLATALELDLDAKPEWRLANLVMQRRARLLLVRIDEFFVE